MWQRSLSGRDTCPSSPWCCTSPVRSGRRRATAGKGPRQQSQALDPFQGQVWRPLWCRHRDCAKLSRWRTSYYKSSSKYQFLKDTIYFMKVQLLYELLCPSFGCNNFLEDREVTNPYTNRSTCSIKNLFFVLFVTKNFPGVYDVFGVDSCLNLIVPNRRTS